MQLLKFLEVVCHGRKMGNNNFSSISKGRGTNVVADLF